MCTPFGARASTLEVTQWQISRRCHPILVAFVSELTKESIHLPLGCLQGGEHSPPNRSRAHETLTGMPRRHSTL